MAGFLPQPTLPRARLATNGPRRELNGSPGTNWTKKPGLPVRAGQEVSCRFQRLDCTTPPPETRVAAANEARMVGMTSVWVLVIIFFALVIALFLFLARR